MSDQPASHTARRATIAAAAAAGVLLLGGIAVASAQPGDPSITDTTIESTTTTGLSPDTTESTIDDGTTTTTVGETTETTIDDTTTTEVEDDTTAPESEGEDEGAHPENHGKVVSEAAHDHSHDDEAGNHGRHVSSVARGESTTSTTCGARRRHDLHRPPWRRWALTTTVGEGRPRARVGRRS